MWVPLLQAGLLVFLIVCIVTMSTCLTAAVMVLLNLIKLLREDQGDSKVTSVRPASKTEKKSWLTPGVHHIDEVHEAKVAAAMRTGTTEDDTLWPE